MLCSHSFGLRDIDVLNVYVHGVKTESDQNARLDCDISLGTEEQAAQC